MSDMHSSISGRVQSLGAGAVAPLNSDDAYKARDTVSFATKSTKRS